MATYPCKTCGHHVAATARVCPNCGVETPAITMTQKLIGLVILLVAVLLVYIFLAPPELKNFVNLLWARIIA